MTLDRWIPSVMHLLFSERSAFSLLSRYMCSDHTIYRFHASPKGFVPDSSLYQDLNKTAFNYLDYQKLKYKMRKSLPDRYCGSVEFNLKYSQTSFILQHVTVKITTIKQMINPKLYPVCTSR